MSFEKDEVQQRIGQFVRTNFPSAANASLSDDDSLLDSGVLDSMGVLEIVTFLETEFDITLDDDDVAGDNFGSIGVLADFVDSKLCQESV